MTNIFKAWHGIYSIQIKIDFEGNSFPLINIIKSETISFYSTFEFCRTYNKNIYHFFEINTSKNKYYN